MAHSIDRERLSALLDGELDDDAREATLTHLADCAPCRAYFAELSALHDALGEADAAAPPADFAAGVLARLHAETAAQSEPPQTAAKRPRRAWRGWATLAACAAVALLVLQTLPRSDTGAPMLTGAGSAPRMSAAAPAAEESVEAPAAAYEEAEAPSGTAEEQLETQMLFLSDGSDAATNAEAAMQQLTEAAPETDAAAPEAAWGEEEAVAPTSEDPGMLCGLAPESAGTAANTAAETGAAETTASTTAETTTADAKENAADAPLTLEGEGAAAWLAEHAEPLGDGLWRVRVEDTLALPETLRLVGLQEPEDGMLTILFGTTENPR